MLLPLPFPLPPPIHGGRLVMPGKLLLLPIPLLLPLLIPPPLPPGRLPPIEGRLGFVDGPPPAPGKSGRFSPPPCPGRFPVMFDPFPNPGPGAGLVVPILPPPILPPPILPGSVVGRFNPPNEGRFPPGSGAGLVLGWFPPS